jgi:hypothetical protein
MSEPLVAIRLKKGVVYISSTYSPGRGTYVNKQPVFTCRTDEMETIGSCVLEALAAFVEGGQIPDWNTYESPVLKAAGVTNAGEFNRGLKDCSVTKEGNSLIVRSELGPTEVREAEGARRLGEVVLQAMDY